MRRSKRLLARCPRGAVPPLVPGRMHTLGERLMCQARSMFILVDEEGTGRAAFDLRSWSCWRGAIQMREFTDAEIISILFPQRPAKAVDEDLELILARSKCRAAIDAASSALALDEMEQVIRAILAADDS